MKVCVTEAAAAHVGLPDWLAVMEQTPVSSRVTVVPETVQTDVLLEAYVTFNPELSVALTGKGAVPKVRLLSAPNVIVCASPTAKLLMTGAAAA